MSKSFENIGCVIMASGLGKRFGGNKLMADFDGEPLIQQIIDITEGIFGKRVVVTRHEDVAELCRRQKMEVIVHDLPNRNDTVRLGLEAIGKMDGCMFCPGDQPLLRKETVISLVENFQKTNKLIWRVCHEDSPGTPVLFPAWTFPELLTLPEGKGGGWVIKRYPAQAEMLPVSESYELMDADTKEILSMLEQIKRTISGRNQHGIFDKTRSEECN